MELVVRNARLYRENPVRNLFWLKVNVPGLLETLWVLPASFELYTVALLSMVGSRATIERLKLRTVVGMVRRVVAMSKN